MKINDNSINNFKLAKFFLLDQNDLKEEDLFQIINEILLYKVDYTDIYLEYSSSETWRLEEGVVKNGTFSIKQGFGIRAIYGEKTAFSYSDSINKKSLLSSAYTVRNISSSGFDNRKIYIKNQYNNQKFYNSKNPLENIDTKYKISILEKLEKYAKKIDNRISQVITSLQSEYDIVLIARSDGQLVTDIRPLVHLSITVIAENSLGHREKGYAAGGARSDIKYFSDEILLQYATRAVKEAINNLSSKASPAGEMPVVLASGWPGILLHEAVGHGLEGDFNRKKSSIFSDKIGELVTSKNITILDNGTLENRRGSLNIDDEGNETKSNVLIENGILKGYMQDILNSKLMNTTPTGNGRRESFAHIPLPRMTNTYMLSGEYDPQEIITSVKKGIYAVNFSGGQVDITNGKFVFSTSEAYLIENGNITHPIKNAMIIGNGPDVMKKISLIGNDLKLDSGVGTCGKDGQNVPVGVGIPTLLIDNITVGGTHNN
ncbi:Metalloprotease TldD [Candidatus Kinetoplastibacterium sorsogonicusi]|uniref:Metalloprotease TldD n=1 Tax=Candidatus Kinetoplastidibacterium kentomonadis TaxID=1576550 RepID=A0A3S7J9W5_9PROT|nr:metalloprotease TldD [Candidatus Kinetoplastibacterium sorsogonicusi]AWD32467.1 Metalloprotease TldD [Candidatus Kinetoplastibacterium sorsogonicusi]